MKRTTLTTLSLIASISTTFAAPTTEPDPLANLPYFNQTQDGYQLEFDDKNYRSLETVVNGATIKFRAFEKIVYVKNPLEPDYQTINFYVPEAYFNGRFNQWIYG